MGSGSGSDGDGDGGAAADADKSSLGRLVISERRAGLGSQVLGLFG